MVLKKIRLKQIIIPLFIFIISFLFFSYRLLERYSFEGDFARDMFQILQISQGKFTLIGPKLSFGGIYTTPFYYYLFVPIYLLTNKNIDAVVLFNTALFSASLSIFYIIVRTHYSFWKSAFAVFAISILPLWYYASRHPNNGFSYLPFLLILFSFFVYVKKFLPIHYFILGILSGIIVGFHYITIMIVFPLFLLLFFETKNKNFLIWYFLGFGIIFAPLILFEIKHGLIMIKNTFVQKSYKVFMDNKNLPDAYIPKKNIFSNLSFISSRMEEWIILKPLNYFVVGIIASIIHGFKHKKSLSLFIISLISFFVLAVTLRFQFAIHYLFPFGFIIFLSLLILLLRSKIGTFVILFFIINGCLHFPNLDFFSSDTQSKYQKFDQAIAYVIANKLIQKNESFNVLQIRKDTGLVPLGYEYRYFFQKKGYKPDSEFAYKGSRKLFIFSEILSLKQNKIYGWEADQFGQEYLKNAKRFVLKDKLVLFIAQKQ